uniref:AMP binding protein n=1 Tax=Mycena chlorophos TaxID=658473 RepID=A0ABQ0M3E4_MYCCL|nr:AMP binding protein [Mycena chlorophos]
MTPKIYSSPFPVPDQSIVSKSIFTHLFASTSPDKVGAFPASLKAFVDAPSGAYLTREQLAHLSLSFAHGLRNHPTTSRFSKRGDVVMIFSPNCLAWPVVVFGAVAAGLRCTLANSAYTAHELLHQYMNSGAQLIIAFEDGISVVRQMLVDLNGLSQHEADGRIIVLGRDLRWAGGPSAKPHSDAAGLLRMEELFGLGKLEGEEKFEGAAAGETVYLCYSSGTTGKPKGVETTHQNMTTLMNILPPAFADLKPERDVMLGILPLYHIYGAAKLLHYPFSRGIPVVLQTRFDPVQFCAAVERYKITICLVAPPVLVVLARHEDMDKYDLSSLEMLYSGAAPLGLDLVKAVKTRLLARRSRSPRQNLVITQAYGLTETSPTTHVLPLRDADRKVGSIGLLLPTLEARLVQDEDGRVDVATGQPGELWVRGKTIMKGYLNNPAATKDAITADGWFKTGDIAVRDKEGFYTIVDRRKELIKYKGYQVPPAELEGILLTHPNIADAAVIALMSEKEATELPRAYIVPADLSKVASKAAFEREVAKWMETKVAYYKRLRGGVVIIDQIPKSGAGKILRRELRERAKQEAARGELSLEVKAKL